MPVLIYIYIKARTFLLSGGGPVPLIPYGLPCVRELFRFLVSLTNPLDRHNTDVMIHMGLSLLVVALETAADHISSYNSLLYLVKDELSRNLSMVRLEFFTRIYIYTYIHFIYILNLSYAI